MNFTIESAQKIVNSLALEGVKKFTMIELLTHYSVHKDGVKLPLDLAATLLSTTQEHVLELLSLGELSGSAGRGGFVTVESALKYGGYLEN